MNKCYGCGAYCENNLCERCFRIKNYNDYKKIDIKESLLTEILDNIKKNDLTVLVIDFLSIPQSFDIFLKKIKGNVILVLSKFDLCPSRNEKRCIDYFSFLDLNIVASFCVSSQNNYNLDILYQSIINNKSNDVYFVGYTNSGKSSLINKLIYNYSDYKSSITVSPLSNTTLDVINVPLLDFNLIDTPGIINKNDITNYLSINMIKKLSKLKRIKPKSYQIKSKQYIYIEDIIKIEATDDIIVYIPPNFSVKRYYQDKKGMIGRENVYNISTFSDVVIPGLCFIKVKSGIIKVTTIYDIVPYLRKSFI